MKVSYKQLWKLLIDKEMKKGDLAKAAGISNFSLTKMGKGGNMRTDVLEKICQVLNCKLGDIMEIIPDTENTKQKERKNNDLLYR